MHGNLRKKFLLIVVDSTSKTPMASKKLKIMTKYNLKNLINARSTTLSIVLIAVVVELANHYECLTLRVAAVRVARSPLHKIQMTKKRLSVVEMKDQKLPMQKQMNKAVLRCFTLKACCSIRKTQSSY